MSFVDRVVIVCDYGMRRSTKDKQLKTPASLELRDLKFLSE